MTRLLALAASTLALAAATPALAQDVTITNARLVIGDGAAPIEGGTVVVRGGSVVYAGPAAGAPAGGQAIDAKGAWVTPGIFATVTSLGLADVAAVDESNDTSAAKSPFSAAIDASTAINPTSQHILVHKTAGITRAATVTSPASSIFAGQGAIIDLDGDPRAVTRARAFQMVDLGENGARIAGGSRAAAHTLLRNALREAEGYGKAANIPGGAARPRDATPGDDTPFDPRLAGGETQRSSDTLLTRFDAAALVPVVRGEQPLYVAVDRAADIRAVLALKRDFPKLDLVLVGATEGWIVAEDIARAGVPVIANGLNDLPEAFEQLGATQSNVGRLQRAGVTVAINAAAQQNPRRLTQTAGNLVALGKMPGATGLTWGQAFAAISAVPAAISGMGGKAGVLKPGALGDVVIWDGDPLELGTVPTGVWIGGVQQDLTNHQTRLRDRYKTLDESARPKAYDW